MEEENKKNTAKISNAKEPKKGKILFSKILSIILGILGLVLVILIIGVGALLAGHKWNPVWNPFKPNSDKMIRDNIIREIKK